MLDANPKHFDECLIKRVLCSKSCTGYLIFDIRNQSLSKFTCDPFCILLGNICSEANEFHMVLLISVCTDFLQLGKMYIFSSLL